ncbi:unnamed protein product, partial [Sphacelaria rigidula]
ARFRWERPGGRAAAFDLEVSPEKGTLTGRQVRKHVSIRYTARFAGPVEEVYACRVFGMASPLGFTFKAMNRGPTLSFGLLEEGEKRPRPIQRPNLPQYLGEEPLPNPIPAPLLDFGRIDLRGRRQLRLFVRNLSAISTPFTAKVRQHTCTPCPQRLKVSNMSYSALQRIVANPRALEAYTDPVSSSTATQSTVPKLGHDPPRGTAAAVGSSFPDTRPVVDSPGRGGPTKRETAGGAGQTHGDSSVPSSKNNSRFTSTENLEGKVVLGAEHEATKVFFSSDGRARTEAQIDQREDCFILKEGLGAAFLVEPATGILPPWGTIEISITAFNDTPGRYSDKLECIFTGEWAPTASMPIKMVVEGSPLVLKREALGLNLSGPEPLLSFGEVFVHGGKTFRIIKVNEYVMLIRIDWD